MNKKEFDKQLSELLNKYNKENKCEIKSISFDSYNVVRYKDEDQLTDYSNIELKIK